MNWTVDLMHTQVSDHFCRSGPQGCHSAQNYRLAVDS